MLMSKEEKRRKPKNKRHHRHFSVLPYFQIPVIFVLISMVVVAPICFGAMSVAVKAVHNAQEVLVKDYNDVEAVTDYQGSDIAEGSVQIPEISVAQKLGVITCENAGLNADVYYGINRVSLRNGVALSVNSSKCGQGKSIGVYGYAGSDFKALKNLENGDIISFETLWGVYKYKVSSKQVLSVAPNPNGGEYLILATEKDNKAFSAFGEDRLYVVAEKLSGPDAEEVEQ